MKKIIFFFVLSLTACEYYTIQNNYVEGVRAGYVVINSGQCLEFFDFPVFGDFPLQFRYKDHQLISDEIYPSGHYKVSEKGDILRQKKPCELDPVRKKIVPKNAREEMDNKAKTTGDSDQTGGHGLEPVEDNEDDTINEQNAEEPEDNLKKDTSQDIEFIGV
ncbi:MAG: hypothetical protein OXN83_05705 [Oligoflexia bacterium]|nr:hypothetical protein [Oligoflexia bacterium]